MNEFLYATRITDFARNYGTDALKSGSQVIEAQSG
jgi:hypothetical protein